MANSIEILLRSKQTVFSVTDLAFWWKIKNSDTLKSKIYYLVSRKKIKRLRRGIFILDEDYNKYELAGKLKKPSYVSLETVLAKENIIFQYSSRITSISNLNRDYSVDKIKYKYHKIKDIVFFNEMGIKKYKNYNIATKERAFLDMLYLNKNYYFDNTDNIDWQKCQDIVKIYNDKQLTFRLQKYVR